jgi:hypothetical protein
MSEAIANHYTAMFEFNRLIIIAKIKFIHGTWQRSSLRHYATSWNVVGSIPDEVIGFFNCPNPSSRTMALGSIQSLTEMSTRNRSGGKGRPACKADSLSFHL